MAPPESSKTDLVVIGAGPGGYAAAFRAADLGREVVLIDPGQAPGGVCLNTGCIPSKALLHATSLIREAREAGAMGLEFGEPGVDLGRLRAWKEEVVGGLTGGLAGLAQSRKVEHVVARARLTGPDSLVLEGGERDGEAIAFEQAILATGSSAVVPGSLATDDPRLMTSEEALALVDIPENLLVVGGGYIGLELGTVYATLGSKVTCVEATTALLPGVDSDLVRPLARRLDGLFEEILLDTTAELAGATDSGLTMKLSGKGDSQERVFSKVLVAVGRGPNSEGLGLGSTDVATDEEGFVEVDASGATSVSTIFAIGDLAGQPMLAHKATHQGQVAAEAASGHAAAFEPATVPAVVFTDPEIAWAGLTETEAKETGRDIKVGRFPWVASGRAATLGGGEGMTKLIADPGTEEVLGIGVVGRGAGDLISEGALAVEMGAVARDLSMTVHPHPTLSETVMEAADVLLGRAISIHRPARGEKKK